MYIAAPADAFISTHQLSLFGKACRLEWMIIAGIVARTNKHFSYLRIQLKAQNSQQPSFFLEKFGVVWDSVSLKLLVNFVKHWVKRHNEVKRSTQTIKVIVLFVLMGAHTKWLPVFLLFDRCLVLTKSCFTEINLIITHQSDLHIFIVIFISCTRVSVRTIQHIFYIPVSTYHASLITGYCK